MSRTYWLVNFTKREMIGSHLRLAASKATEIVGSHGACALAIWYMIRNKGDLISFVNDDDLNLERECMGFRMSWKELDGFADRTDETLRHAIEAQVLQDHGFEWRDEMEPEKYFLRDIRVNAADGPRFHDL